MAKRKRPRDALYLASDGLFPNIKRRKRNDPFKGNVTIVSNSSLRKRMRAVRRGLVDPWWPATPDAVKRMRERYGVTP